MKITVVIPNYNGMKYLPACLQALAGQQYPAHILIVDNGSADGSAEWIRQHYPEYELCVLPENTGFCNAVNMGIQMAQTPYVLLLNNDTQVKPGFLENMEKAIEQSDKIFSVSAKMLCMAEESRMDNAGDLYCGLGWAFARGGGKPAVKYEKPARIFSACGGAVIYRKELLEKIGVFDNTHFAYLEDVDIGWRARIYGYENRYEPKAQVLHAGSGVTGSKHNAFKVTYSSANSVRIIRKNMPIFQRLLNLPLLLFGFFIKTLFFTAKGMGGIYIKGCLRGLKESCTKEGRERKVPFYWRHFGNYIRIQLALWWNILRILYN